MMKIRFHRILSVSLLLCMLVALLPSAFADESSAEDTAAENTAASADDSRFAGKTWEEVIDDWLAERGLDGSTVAMGYYNLVTGEEHYYNGDEYIVAGSMYKVPLNMIFAERISNGEMDLDTAVGGMPYSYDLEATIVNSNNDVARSMWDTLGSYHEYRRTIAPYMGEDPDNVDDQFYVNNLFTSRQMITCLRTLYDNPDRFPYIIDTMKKAEPSKYFCRDENRFEIAHKYGYLDDNGTFYLNDCAIVYTDDPIAIVMFTHNADNPYGALATYCTLMCDYAQYTHEQRLIAEQKAAEEAQAEAERQAAEQAQQEAQAAVEAAENAAYSEAENAASVTEESSGSGFSFAALILALLIMALTALAVFLVFRSADRIAKPPAAAAVVLTGLALLLGVLGYHHGTLITKTSGSPQTTVSAFFDDLKAGDYEDACTYLNGYTSLGLEKNPSSAAAGKVYRALRDSYDYELVGDCARSGLKAAQSVKFTHLDVAALDAAVKAKLAADGTSGDEAYSAALDELLADPTVYYRNDYPVIYLEYDKGSWSIVSADKLIECIEGITA